MGLMEGIPNTIPVASEDFIFAAITEELGLCFSLCLILICLSTFIMFINIATKIREPFYKLLAAGFGIEYIFQVFLTIGGGTKFIPLTGVTLPLVSYGGSSVLCTLVVFHVIQGIYVLKQAESKESEEEYYEDEEPDQETAYAEDEYYDEEDEEYYDDDRYYDEDEYYEDDEYYDEEDDEYYDDVEDYDEDEYYDDDDYRLDIPEEYFKK